MAKQMEADMRRRFWIALAFTIPVTVIAGHLPGVPMLVQSPVANWLGPDPLYAGGLVVRLDLSLGELLGPEAATARHVRPDCHRCPGAWLSSVYLTVIGQPTAFYEACRDAGHLRPVRALDGDAVAAGDVRRSPGPV
jgi:hypothetical protein